MKIYQIDPDFRPEIPRNEDGTFKPHCCQCRKEIKNLKGRAVLVNWDNWQVVAADADRTIPMRWENPQAEIHDELIGSDCWKNLSEVT